MKGISCPSSLRSKMADNRWVPLLRFSNENGSSTGESGLPSFFCSTLRVTPTVWPAGRAQLEGPAPRCEERARRRTQRPSTPRGERAWARIEAFCRQRVKSELLRLVEGVVEVVFC